jgi:hypothetical protein
VYTTYLPLGDKETEDGTCVCVRRWGILLSPLGREGDDVMGWELELGVEEAMGGAVSSKSDWDLATVGDYDRDCC